MCRVVAKPSRGLGCLERSVYVRSLRVGLVKSLWGALIYLAVVMMVVAWCICLTCTVCVERFRKTVDLLWRVGRYCFWEWKLTRVYSSVAFDIIDCASFLRVFRNVDKIVRFNTPFRLVQLLRTLVSLASTNAAVTSLSWCIETSSASNRALSNITWVSLFTKSDWAWTASALALALAAAILADDLLELLEERDITERVSYSRLGKCWVELGWLSSFSLSSILCVLGTSIRRDQRKKMNDEETRVAAVFRPLWCYFFTSMSSACVSGTNWHIAKQ